MHVKSLYDHWSQLNVLRSFVTGHRMLVQQHQRVVFYNHISCYWNWQTCGRCIIRNFRKTTIPLKCQIHHSKNIIFTRNTFREIKSTPHPYGRGGGTSGTSKLLRTFKIQNSRKPSEVLKKLKTIANHVLLKSDYYKRSHE